jgi:antirestriction protein ArdC
MTKERFDIHQHITDTIVSAIERGAGEFRLPWHRGAGNIIRPVNIASKKAYRGVNVVALWAYAEASGYSSGTWGTYRPRKPAAKGKGPPKPPKSVSHTSNFCRSMPGSTVLKAVTPDK